MDEGILRWREEEERMKGILKRRKWNLFGFSKLCVYVFIFSSLKAMISNL
jgi:hypothetical protein